MDSKLLEDKIDRIELKLDAVLEKITEHKIILNKQQLVLENQNQQLEIHIRRSDNLENYVQLLEDKFEEDLKNYSEKLQIDLRPLQKHILVVDTIMKAFGAVCVIIGAVVGIMQLFKVI